MSETPEDDDDAVAAHAEKLAEFQRGLELLKQLEEGEKAKVDHALFCEKRLKILTKRGELKTFVMNKAQRYVHERLEEQKRLTGRVRALIPKSRQVGISTYVNSRFYHDAVQSGGQKVFILSHEQDSTDGLFNMVRRFHENDPQAPSTRAASSKTLWFAELDSRYEIATAGTTDVGRSQTIQRWHGSEVASWKDAEAHMAGIGQCVPDLPNTEIIFEATGKGVGNLFYQKCMDALDGKGEYQMIFVPWFWDEDYRRPVPPNFVLTAAETEYQSAHGLTLEQMAWRRNKIVSDLHNDESLFAQEYPATVLECFQAKQDRALISSTVVTLCQKTKHVRKGILKLGVDPARFGNDRTAMVLRDDNGVLWRKTYHGLAVTACAAKVVAILKEIQAIAEVYIDTIGIGGGVYDILALDETAGSKVRSVNVAERAKREGKFVNRRAELWVGMRDWLPGKALPEGQDILVDLCSLHYDYDAKNRYILESKDDAGKRGVKSPDIADALALTFAEAGANDQFAAVGWVRWKDKTPLPKCEKIIRCLALDFDEHGGSWATTEWGIFKPADDQACAIILNCTEGRGTLAQLTLEEKKVWRLDAETVKADRAQFPMGNRKAQEGLPHFLVMAKGGHRDPIYRHLMRERILCKRIRYDDATGPQVFGETIAAGRVFMPERKWALRVQSDVARYPSGERPLVVHSVAMALLWLRWMGQVRPEDDEDEPAVTRTAKPIYG